MVGLDNVKAKINRFYPKKIVLDTIRRDVFLYIYIYIYIFLSFSLSLSLSLSLSFEFDYKSSSCCYSVFPLISRSPFLSVFFLFYTVFLLSSPPSTCRPRFLCRSMSYQHLPYVFESSCKAENYCLSITSTLMRPES